LLRNNDRHREDIVLDDREERLRHRATLSEGDKETTARYLLRKGRISEKWRRR
jgi:hypothetical protein